MQSLAQEKIGKKETALRLGCFLAVYPLFYFVPILLLCMPLSALQRLPGQVVNNLFVVPVLTFPFGNIESDNGQNCFFNSPMSWLVTGAYLLLLGFLFLKLVKPIRKWRWVIPLAFCFSAVSIFLLNVLFITLGVQVIIDSP